MIRYDVDFILNRVEREISDIQVDILNPRIAMIEYEKKLNDVISSVKVNTVRLKITFKYRVEGKNIIIELKSCIRDMIKYRNKTVVNYENSNYFEIIKQESIHIVKSIIKYKFAEYFVECINNDLQEICSDCDILLQFSFGRNTIEDIGDSYVTIGLSVEQALLICELTLYKPLNCMLYSVRLKQDIMVCQTPFQIIKYDLEILKDLGVYTRSRVELLMRKRYTRSYQYIGKNGIGYILTDEYFALIESINGEEHLKLRPVSIKDYLFVNEDLGFEVESV